MKRDFELVRKLLIFFEEKEGPEAVESPEIEGYDNLTIMYHLVLLHDAHFLRCEPTLSTTSDRVIQVLPFDLTWEGHEFLAKIRSDSRWKAVRDAIMSKGMNLGVSIINHVATQQAKALLDGI